MTRFVVLDVETTGVSFSKGDRIIQLAYSVVENGEITDNYATYLNPNRTIPPFIKTLTNITDEHVTHAPTFATIAPVLLQALEGAYFVAHNVEFDLNFINDELIHAGYTPFQGPLLDTVELARIAFPTEDSFRLSELSERFNMTHTTPHRADSDATATALLLMEIFETFDMLPLLTLQQLEKLSPALKSDLGAWLSELIAKKTTQPHFIEEVESYRGLALKNHGLTDEQQQHDEDSCEVIPTVDTLLHQTLTDEMGMSDKMPAYELREGQIDMIRFIDDVFKEDSIGLIEAGTGTGKTLGYLIPAAIFAKTSNEQVVISTETIQLQDQLLKNELPTLKKLLPFSIKTALLKGRSHYLCLQKFENLLLKDPMPSYDRTLSKAQILVWLTITDTGDVEELNLASGNTRFWYEIASDAKSCANPSCPWFTRCYYQRAKKKSKQADLIITNHSLLFTDMVADHQVIPKYATLIVDEAHHLEETATRQLGEKLDYLTITQVLNDVASRDKVEWLPESIAKLAPDYMREKAENITRVSTEFKQEWNDLFIQMNHYVTRGTAGKNETGRLSKIIAPSDEKWLKVRETAARCEHLFKSLLITAHDIVQKVDDVFEQEEIHPTNEQRREREWLLSILYQIESQYVAFNHVILQQQENEVYWLEVETRGPKQSISIQSSPISVAERLADDFFTYKKRVILTSATLTVNNKFNYMIQRLGLEDFPVKTKQVASPFSWSDQVALMVPDDMPLIQDAGEDAYIEAASLQIYRTAQVTKGKMLVLFTSYDMLKRTYALLKNMLDESFMIVAQGIHTKSRSKLTKNFQQFEQSILLGTSSFWEGVDIPGTDLSCILMARLPFSPPNDPVFKKRSDLLKEQGDSPFMKLALPQAVIRFKQGFGRLIRRSTDKGVVIVLDRRLVTTRYGKSFINSLPEGIPFIEEPMDVLEDHMANWFNDLQENENGE
ncbi:ATP-dependent DNA helicase DinG [Salipaludibacillus sp. LMS25]|uniref:ATP-dependent DNA helicase DinG n=1 Tax=Salipaludibacillus sp. LMS25 TaxID=2924031 RepID=UPI0020D06E9F|nr:ATP-dependent DNA helicase DinG [Salipaludibacillus sp. LMS25]UTR14662.1 ATP-dependent DNA helicase DinG [Salipaludibacillus sp. LMS25]